jgi:hypothetical protein
LADRPVVQSYEDAAYRRLAVAILGLDVATLAAELRSTRRPALADIASASTPEPTLVPFTTTGFQARSA